MICLFNDTNSLEALHDKVGVDAVVVVEPWSDDGHHKNAETPHGAAVVAHDDLSESSTELQSSLDLRRMACLVVAPSCANSLDSSFSSPRRLEQSNRRD